MSGSRAHRPTCSPSSSAESDLPMAEIITPTQAVFLVWLVGAAVFALVIYLSLERAAERDCACSRGLLHSISTLAADAPALFPATLLAVGLAWPGLVLVK